MALTERRAGIPVFGSSKWWYRCHQVPLDGVEVGFEFRDEDHRVIIRATARARWVTGVEMEALTAVTVAALTLYDMCKAADRGMVIEGVSLLRKIGGRSGEYRRE